MQSLSILSYLVCMAALSIDRAWCAGSCIFTALLSMVGSVELVDGCQRISLGAERIGEDP